LNIPECYIKIENWKKMEFIIKKFPELNIPECYIKIENWKKMKFIIKKFPESKYSQ
jgi:hypothetical protein